MKFEIRFRSPEIRSNPDGSMKVSGYVNKVDQWSEILGGVEKFREKIAKGAFAKALENRKGEIEFLAEHDCKLILASTRNGSLKLIEDDEGLYMEATITPTTWGKDYHTLITEGLIQSMSFGFRCIKDSWKAVDGMYERIVEELELFEVSAVKEPAYSQSTISARGYMLVEDVEIPNEIIKENLNMEAMLQEILERLNILTEAVAALQPVEEKAEEEVKEEEEYKAEPTEEEMEKAEEMAEEVEEEIKEEDRAEDAVTEEKVAEEEEERAEEDAPKEEEEEKRSVTSISDVISIRDLLSNL